MKRIAPLLLLLTGCGPSEAALEAPTPKPFYSKPPGLPPAGTVTPPPVEDTRTTASLRGAVYDTAGHAVPDDVIVRIKAVRPPFDRIVQIKAGLYATTGIPLRADLTLTIERAGKVLLTRNRGPLGGNEIDAVFNFGVATGADPEALKAGVPL
ncbi:MAG: hypothetical protein JWM80_1887 [Cyanobacteria bacterium RYN_339]|nr:hypothetical protein [Cyanobacteria bacterium RYN_339]